MPSKDGVEENFGMFHFCPFIISTPSWYMRPSGRGQMVSMNAELSSPATEIREKSQCVGVIDVASSVNKCKAERKSCLGRHSLHLHGKSKPCQPGQDWMSEKQQAS